LTTVDSRIISGLSTTKNGSRLTIVEMMIADSDAHGGRPRSADQARTAELWDTAMSNHFAYPTFAAGRMSRRDNLKASIMDHRKAASKRAQPWKRWKRLETA